MEDEMKSNVDSPETQENQADMATDELQGEAIEIDMNAANEGEVEAVENTIQTELEAAKKRAAEANEQYLRLMAEFDNFRKRSRRETETLLEFASEKVLTVLLPVLDDFERTIDVIEKTDNLTSIKEGIGLVHDKLLRVLEKEGLNRINAKNEDFDSELHEAIHSIESPEEQKGKVLEEVEKGYRLKDKVIRYSKVIVGE